MNYKIYTIGDKVEKYYLNAINEYIKRLGRYCKISHIHFKNYNVLSTKYSKNEYVILINNKGNNISSEDLSQKINYLAINSISNISFVIGYNIDIKCDEIISISSMEMDLGLKATVIAEQLYRAYRIINNESYHK